MLIRFTTENYKSINKPTQLSFVAESLKQHEETNLISTGFPKLNLLKSLAVYGANASGKSNLIKALSFMKNFVLSSASEYQHNKAIDIEPYKLLLKNLEEPSCFEVDFIVNENRYRYGFKVSKKRVETEYLFSVLKTTEKILFKRSEKNLEFGISFSEGYGKENFVKPRTLFLSTLAQLNGTISSMIIEWFTNLMIINDYNYHSFTGYTAKLLKDHQHTEFLLKVFRAVGLEFEEVEIKTVNIDDNLTQFLSEELKELVRKSAPQQFKVYTKHKVLDANGQELELIDFDLKEESAGTQKFFAIAGPVINCLLNGYPIFIDEMDARLHFKLVYFLVNLFNNKRFNPFGGQLVFSNHMIELMDRELLRRDQIILVSKTRTGTQLKSIHQLGARSDSSFKKEYLSGEYGALPDTEFNQLDLFDKFS